MALKNWFGRSTLGRSTETLDSAELTVDELIVVERYEEARDSLTHRLRYHPHDLHAHLKLAEVCQTMGEADTCKQEYLLVARAYAQDGFYNKARAILAKVSRLFPGEIDVEKHLSALQRAKRLERSRDRARAGLLAGRNVNSPSSGLMAIEFETMWKELSKTDLVDRFSSEDFSRLFAVVEIIDAPVGRVLAHVGVQDQVLFLIAEGAVEARVRDSREHLVTLLAFGPGDIVGEAALFSNTPWPASYHCTTKARLLKLERSGLEELIAGHNDPKRLLDILRGQNNDQKVARAVRHLKE